MRGQVDARKENERESGRAWERAKKRGCVIAWTSGGDGKK
jgi:hypothetical protein